MRSTRAVFAVVLAACSSGTTGGTDGGCALAGATTATSVTSSSGCAVRSRDTSACSSSRTAAGLGGLWLAFSCRVTLSVSGGTVRAQADGQPDYPSNYFPTGDACHETYTAAIQNPNTIAAKTYDVSFPLGPDLASASMQGTAVVGLALNGVPIYGNFAAPGDDIFNEARTFDRCAGHPQMAGAYHYHSEPYALSFDDANLIGVMRDGWPIYGRKDTDGGYPTLDTAGGHADTGGGYHYHVNEQTSTGTMTAGQKQWFLTTGTYRGTPGACASGCN